MKKITLWIERLFMPSFLKRLDTRLLERYPLVWQSRVPLFTYWNLLLGAISILAGLFLPVGYYLLSENWSYAFIGLYLLFFLIYMVYFINSGMSISIRSGFDFYKSYLMHFWNLISVYLVFWLFISVLFFRIENTYTEKEIFLQLKESYNHIEKAETPDIYRIFLDRKEKQKTEKSFVYIQPGSALGFTLFWRASTNFIWVAVPVLVLFLLSFHTGVLYISEKQTAITMLFVSSFYLLGLYFIQTVKKNLNNPIFILAGFAFLVGTIFYRKWYEKRKTLVGVCLWSSFITLPVLQVQLSSGNIVLFLYLQIAYHLLCLSLLQSYWLRSVKFRGTI